MDNIVLIGFMGSGKSTTAKLLSMSLNIPFIDSDTYIAEQEKSSIKDIFAYKGEAYFRRLEALFIESFSTQKGYIIATGGGMPIFNSVKKLGICFYLQSDFNTIKQRILQENETTQENTRPLFNDIPKAFSLYNERVKIYENSCDYIIDSRGDTQVIVDTIISLIPNVHS
ncbi:shikimate kinase [Helicobacter trogontum]|uniref:shikimate kinase n=1 Tax=Helicobacter trogontum TaxID=50960 RepID=UPI000CF1AE34|nr:shikimate kinase [Helicobacter trogontum]